MLDNKKIYDPHIHARPTSENLDECIRDAMDFLSFTGVEGANILIIKGEMWTLGDDSVYLYLKTLHPDKFSVFNGLAVGYNSIPYDAEGLVTQVKDMMDVGFDGLKIWINGSTKEAWGFELDEETMDPMWSYLEETGYPVLIHIGNTERWPAQRGPGSEVRRKAPPRKLGNEPDNERLYNRMEHVLTRHPNLNIVIPHLYFMCEQKERLSALMENHPNVKLDICPGSAMYYYMSQDVEYWRNFFVKYQDRLLFGTDNFMERTGGLEQILKIRRFLETGDTYFAQFYSFNSWGFDVTGIGPLSDEILNKIYKTNFEKVRGDVRQVNIENAIKYLEKELSQMEQLSEEDASMQSRAFVREVITRFKAKR